MQDAIGAAQAGDPPRVGFGALHGGQALLEPGFQGAGDQPVARLDLAAPWRAAPPPSPRGGLKLARSRAWMSCQVSQSR